ncbi:MAG: alpha/beta hydrolase [Spirochaetes bacterium]|nr:alpha/beta hydrolase [Spirochaetota bacterium]
MDAKENILKQITQKIRETGSSFDLSIIQRLGIMYAPLLKDAPRDGIKVTKDLRYGDHDRHRLDVYQPLTNGEDKSPVILFFHGGGFVSGDKNEYGNVGNYFARHGIVTVNVTYRLAPEYRWPSGAEDVAGALRWIQKKVADYGGDTGRVFVFGHSAGAAHVASYVFLDQFALKDGDGVAGAILMSGPNYNTDNLDERAFAYFGNDKSRHPEMSVIRNMGKRKIPVYIMFAEYDIPSFDRESILLLNAVYKRDRVSPFFKKIVDHNHFSEIMHLNSGDESVGPDIIDFVFSRERVK